MNDDTGQGEFGTKNNMLTNAHIREWSGNIISLKQKQEKAEVISHQKVHSVVLGYMLTIYKTLKTVPLGYVFFVLI